MTHVPAEIEREIDGYSRKSLPTVNHGGSVLELSSPRRPRLFLKIEARPSTLEHEMLRLEWLEGKLSAPRVVAYASDEVSDFLLLTALPGIDATEDADPQTLRERVELVAKGLRQIHETDVSSCPFDRSLNTELALARARVDQGLVGEADLEDHQKGRPIETIIDALDEQRPSSEAAVLTHGDYSLPNVMIDRGRLTGFLDWRDGGIGDPYRDLPIVIKSIIKNWGEEWLSSFYEFYGVNQEDMDEEKMEYYRLLYRFF